MGGLWRVRSSYYKEYRCCTEQEHREGLSQLMWDSAVFSVFLYQVYEFPACLWRILELQVKRKNCVVF